MENTEKFSVQTMKTFSILLLLIDSLLRKIHVVFIEAKWIIKILQLKGDLRPKNTLIKAN